MEYQWERVERERAAKEKERHRGCFSRSWSEALCLGEDGRFEKTGSNKSANSPHLHHNLPENVEISGVKSIGTPMFFVFLICGYGHTCEAGNAMTEKSKFIGGFEEEDRESIIRSQINLFLLFQFWYIMASKDEICRGRVTDEIYDAQRSCGTVEYNQAAR